jgi:hypothetical protein
LIPDDAALLDYEATVHVVKMEHTSARPPPSGAPSRAPSGGRIEDDDFGDDRGNGRPSRGHHQQHLARPRAALGAGNRDPPRWWRGSAERRVALHCKSSIMSFITNLEPTYIIVSYKNLILY